MIHSSQVQMQQASVKLLDDLNTICGQFLKPNGSFITKCLVTWFKIRCITRLIPSRTLRKYLWPLCLSFRGFLLLQLFLRFEIALLQVETFSFVPIFIVLKISCLGGEGTKIYRVIFEENRRC